MKAYQRLIEYAKYPTVSHENAGKVPSTDVQFELADYLVKELLALGLTDAAVDDKCYVTATLEANVPDWDGKTVGFIAHIDVSDEVACENVKTSLVENYDGADVLLSEGNILSSDMHPILKKYIGKTLLVTDGTTLLGADDKAGIAEIMTMLEILVTDPSIKHGTIKVCFTPDEEVGGGADDLDIEKFGADFAYTVDGATAGEVEYQNFNATNAVIRFKGVSIHPGDAKDILVNAAGIAAKFDTMLPYSERPETTEGFQGFYHLVEMKGDVENAELIYILRDHNKDILEIRKQNCVDIAAKLCEEYGEGAVSVEFTDSYLNMEPIIKKYPEILEAAREATREAGVEPVSNPIRGGTDGARLSYRGLPCPNLGTGSHNHHGRFEFACCEAMDTVTQILVNIAKKFA